MKEDSRKYILALKKIIEAGLLSEDPRIQHMVDIARIALEPDEYENDTWVF